MTSIFRHQGRPPGTERKTHRTHHADADDGRDEDQHDASRDGEDQDRRGRPETCRVKVKVRCEDLRNYSFCAVRFVRVRNAGRWLCMPR